jgi:hypothetical protein
VVLTRSRHTENEKHQDDGKYWGLLHNTFR